jgi:hypothetical protein
MTIRQAGTITFATTLLALPIAMVTSIAGCGGSSGCFPPPNPLLLRNYVVQLSIVNQYFDSITQQDGTGEDSTAQGNPNATRAVFLIDDADTQKVTITVDRYNSTSDAASAYEAALEKSEEVPGFTPITIPSVGQQSFAGSITQGMAGHNDRYVRLFRKKFKSESPIRAALASESCCYLQRRRPHPPRRGLRQRRKTRAG